MKRRKIDPETKMAAALEGLKGEGSVAEICRKYQISESLYYRWRDKFLEAGSRALASRNGSGPEAAAKTKISEQERIIGKQAEAGFPDLKYLGSRDPAGEAQILARIREIKLRHPFWGYRRVRAWLKYREDLPVGHKRVYRLRRENELLVPQKRYRAKRQPAGLKPRAQRPGQFWGIDLTKFIVPDLGWAYLVIVLDWFSRKVVGWQLSCRCRTQEWCEALEEAVLREFPHGVRGQGLKLVSDNGCQPTSRSFLKVTATLDIEQIFTSFNNPKGNAETERFMRTLKEELLWLEEFAGLEEAREKLSAWIDFYNKDYLHSALGYKSPQEYERLYRETNLKKAA